MLDGLAVEEASDDEQQEGHGHEGGRQVGCRHGRLGDGAREVGIIRALLGFSFIRGPLVWEHWGTRHHDSNDASAHLRDL